MGVGAGGGDRGARTDTTTGDGAGRVSHTHFWPRDVTTTLTFGVFTHLHANRDLVKCPVLPQALS